MMDIENLLKELKRAERYCLNDYSRMAGQASTALSTLQAENEKLRAELEQARENNEKLIAAMMTIRKSENPERMRVVYEMDYSTAIDHQTARDIAVIVFEGLMREDLRLCGQKED